MPDKLLNPADTDQAERLHTFAHDIKNRLGALWETLRLLRSAPDDGLDQEQLMSFAERGFFHAQRDLETLLDDFGVERGIRADRSPFDLTKSVEDALKNEDYRLRKKGQRVDVQGPPGLHASGDGRLTTQIIQALISNASKFSPRDAVIALEVSNGNDGCKVHVSDGGCGLSAEDLVHVFTRYSILSSRSTDGEPQSRGTLARVKQWAEAQSGALDAASEGVSRGCVFTLQLPGV
jgi:signal transduction histidine kinase